MFSKFTSNIRIKVKGSLSLLTRFNAEKFNQTLYPIFLCINFLNEVLPTSIGNVSNLPFVYPMLLLMNLTNSTNLFSFISTICSNFGSYLSISFTTLEPMLPAPPIIIILLFLIFFFIIDSYDYRNRSKRIFFSF